ncbi:MAG: DUF4177 domain-containing protein [Rhodobacteraceae bacterium]|nr:MAG: DUF4177 domain-containing protein [Paracoccaceae bacterium]
MQVYEYLALPAPRRSGKIKGLKTPAERFAHELTVLMNEVASEGWEFWRSECLPSDERKGFTGTMVVQNHLLIFRRLTADALAEKLPQTSAPTSTAPEPRIDPVMLDRPSDDAPIYDTRREPMFRASTPVAER